MVELIKYSEIFKHETLFRISDFFNYHTGLYNPKNNDEDLKQAENNLIEWVSSDHDLYMIKRDKVVGFIHLWYKGKNVVWIEHIYVDKANRCQGIASDAIKVVEKIVKSKPQYSAICIDVVPRNIEALHLYHKLGFDSLSMITMRKEVYTNKKYNKDESLLGLKFKI